jgi:hypothetical protein
MAWAKKRGNLRKSSYRRRCSTVWFDVTSAPRRCGRGWRPRATATPSARHSPLWTARPFVDGAPVVPTDCSIERRSILNKESETVAELARHSRLFYSGGCPTYFSTGATIAKGISDSRSATSWQPDAVSSKKPPGARSRANSSRARAVGRGRGESVLIDLSWRGTRQTQTLALKPDTVSGSEAK